MITAVRSGRLDVDGERYRIRAGCTGWSEGFVEELEINEPAVRAFFPLSLEELLEGDLCEPESGQSLEAAFCVLDGVKRLAGLGCIPDSEAACAALWTLLEPVVYPEEN